MVSVTKKFQITIPLEVRKDLNIHQGDKVVFIKDNENKWVLMTVEELTDRMVTAAKDIDETIAESKKGFKKGIDKSLKSLNNEN